jgi:hypothetical protein
MTLGWSALRNGYACSWHMRVAVRLARAPPRQAGRMEPVVWRPQAVCRPAVVPHQRVAARRRQSAGYQPMAVRQVPSEPLCVAQHFRAKYAQLKDKHAHILTTNAGVSPQSGCVHFAPHRRRTRARLALMSPVSVRTMRAAPDAPVAASRCRRGLASSPSRDSCKNHQPWVSIQSQIGFVFSQSRELLHDGSVQGNRPDPIIQEKAAFYGRSCIGPPGAAIAARRRVVDAAQPAKAVSYAHVVDEQAREGKVVSVGTIAAPSADGHWDGK